MKLFLFVAIIAMIAVGVVTGCQNAPAPKISKAPVTASPVVDEHDDNAPRISLSEAKKEFDAGTAVFVDTRAESVYKQEHIKDAMNIPVEAVESKYKELPTDKKIIAYCS
ncbi:MAG TPA: rhodanese-like domain-containing protein [Pyrinomonadaceae bacterium]|nr:rhodanese-like domain-containing protein [Pyrinomonadaceae bacterium]HNU07195.1 rhodanese-like domain-containing protein [Pyrinomonadaceae bacterium]